MTTVRPYKFQVVAIVQHIDDETGKVTGEDTVTSAGGQPFTLFGVDQLAQWAEQFPANLAAMAQAGPEASA